MSALSDKLTSLGVPTPFTVPKAEAALVSAGKGPDDLPESSATPIKDALAQIPNARDRAEVKGCAWKDSGTFARVTQGDYDIQVTEINEIDGGVEMYARAWDGDGDQIGFGKDGSVDLERFRFVNPPVMVPDGTTRQVYDESVGQNVELNNYKEDVAAALKMALSEAVRSAGKTLKSGNIVPGKKGSTVTTVYPDADPETTSVDGYCQCTTNQTWTNCVNDAGGTGSDTDTSVNVGWADRGLGFPNEYIWINRGLFLFDTSSIPSGDSISAATLSLYGSAKSDNSVSWAAIFEVAIVTSNPASDTAVVAGDYDSLGDTIQNETNITYAGWSTAGYNDFTLNSTGIGNIAKGSGVSKFGLRTNRDIADSDPGQEGAKTIFTGFYAADQAGAANDPKLTVTHAALVASGNLTLMNAG